MSDLELWPGKNYRHKKNNSIVYVLDVVVDKDIRGYQVHFQTKTGNCLKMGQKAFIDLFKHA